MNERRLFLIGYRGTGKTTVARLVAARLGWSWCDADEILEEQAGMTIREIFAAEGEAGFREREAKVLTSLCQLDHHVIATGGGVILRPDNRERLRGAGRIVWLTADAQTLWQRLQREHDTDPRRPPLTVGGFAEIEELLRHRELLYRACADDMVDTVGRSPEDVAVLVTPRGRPS